MGKETPNQKPLGSTFTTATGEKTPVPSLQDCSWDEARKQGLIGDPCPDEHLLRYSRPSEMARSHE